MQCSKKSKNWYQKFRDGNYNLNELYSGQLKIFEDEKLQLLLTQDSINSNRAF